MSVAPSSESQLIDRVERLERQNRTLKYALAAVGFLALLAFAAVLEMEARPERHRFAAADTIAAQKFVLQGKEGRQYAALRLDEVTYLEEGKPAEKRWHPLLEFYGENALLPRVQLVSDR